jgi:hypothetical protein
MKPPLYKCAVYVLIAATLQVPAICREMRDESASTTVVKNESEDKPLDSVEQLTEIPRFLRIGKTFPVGVTTKFEASENWVRCQKWEAGNWHYKSLQTPQGTIPWSTDMSCGTAVDAEGEIWSLQTTPFLSFHRVHDLVQEQIKDSIQVIVSNENLVQTRIHSFICIIDRNRKIISSWQEETFVTVQPKSDSTLEMKIEGKKFDVAGRLIGNRNNTATLVQISPFENTKDPDIIRRFETFLSTKGLKRLIPQKT